MARIALLTAALLVMLSTSSGISGAFPSGMAGHSVPTTITLSVPDSTVVGQSVTLSAKVVANNGAIPAGFVTFYKDNQNIGQATLNINGLATLPTGSLTLGTYYFTARYTSNGGEAASESLIGAVTVYQAPPDLALSLSPRTLRVSYGTISEALTLVITSRYGLAGNVEFSCSGLPDGMVCKFSPEQIPLKPDGSATSSFTIAGATTKKELIRGFAIFGVLASMAVGVGVLGRKKRPNFRWPLWITLLLLAAIAACGENKNLQADREQPGPRTILVNATAGTSTRSITLLLDVQ